MIVRPEEQKDWLDVYRVNATAFTTPAEAKLVDALRGQARPAISLVAEEDGQVVGHILFSPMTLPDHPTLILMGLAPVAVIPSHQNQGIGSALVRAGLDACRQMDADAVAVLGHATYYPRFGFVPSTRFAIRSVYDVPDDVFMILELKPGSLTGTSGTIQYHAAFNDL